MNPSKNGVDHLFVYGSLLQGSGSEMSVWLSREGTLIGWTSVTGSLYDLGEYPALVMGSENSGRVRGQLFHCSNMQRLLTKLDHYEGTDYTRLAYWLDTLFGRLNCWVYVYNLPFERFPRIPDENYLDYLARNERHQAFIRSV